MIASPGDTLVFGARQVALLSLSPPTDYEIAAEQMTVVPGAGTSLTGSDPNPSPSVTVLANSIEGAPQPCCLGATAGIGEDGEAGAPGGNITISYGVGADGNGAGRYRRSGRRRRSGKAAGQTWAERQAGPRWSNWHWATLSAALGQRQEIDFANLQTIKIRTCVSSAY